MTELEAALDDIRYFVQFVDGSTERFLALDTLIWRARLAVHHEPEMQALPKPHGLEALLADIGL
jgi:hypothetical protein